MHDFSTLQRDSLVAHLRKHVRGEVRFDDLTRRLYSTDASIFQVTPLGVVIPRTAQDLVTAVQIAGEMRVPVTARGGGTSLSGQSIGTGLVIDCSKYLNNVLDVDPAGRTARVQPGVVLDQFNRALAPHGMQFAPDVATASRANLGGMIGNNSAGARSVVYGKTVDHVRSLSAVLADGSTATFGKLRPGEWDRKAEARTREGQVYREVRRTVEGTAEEIRRRFPRIVRRVSGYDLLTPLEEGPERGLIPLLVGSEGTLAVVTEAEVGLVPRPRCRGLLVPQFATLADSLDAVAACLEAGPSAVELMDGLLIELAHTQLSLKETMAAIKGRPKALLMVEFSSDDPAEVADRVEKLRKRLDGVAGLTACVPALDPAVRDPLWDLRRASMPLLYGIPGDRKPVTFIEDPAVPPERLPEFIAEFRAALRRHGTDGAFYGHASVGCLHIRPVLNLKDPADVATMRAIMEEVTDLVLRFGGSLSGEHGDGLVRSEWNRKMYGPEVYEAFRRVKAAFDPDNLLNPGKVVNAPSMTESLRYGPGYQPVNPPTVFDYSRQEGFFRSVELCNGNGACRKLQGGTMCPSFRATRDERDSTRARANALRLAIGAVNPVPERQRRVLEVPVADAPGPDRSPMRRRWLYETMDLCLMCKACKAECPSNVDLAKLKAEFLNAYYAGRTRPLGHYLLRHIHRLNELGSWFAPLANWAGRQPALRWLLEKAAGIDRRRSLPPLYFDHFRRWFARRRPAEGAGRNGTVLLFDDCFTTFNEPEVGRAAVRVLEHAGYRVELAGRVCCGRAMISKGFLPEARALARAQLPGLARRVADGTPLLGLEPSCLLTVADEWTELVPGAASRRVAASAELAEVWLAKQVKAGRCRLDLARTEGKCLLHGHCHQKALQGARGSAAALALIPGLDVSVLDAGCCGMAGSFGYEREHFDVSERIANLELVPAVKAAPNATVAATGTSCRHQLRDLAGRHARHPLELLAEAIKE
jgi:FAD/FMN-containing dehydrogenase/Fe-S oxidoreductase